MRFDPKCERVEESVRFGQVLICSVRYEMTPELCLTLQLESSTEGHFQLVFDNPFSVRIIDESQVCEFWNTYSTPNGWLWQVLDGGYLALESQRAGFWAAQAFDWLLEYLVVDDQCVFVITGNPPRFAPNPDKY